MLTIRPGRGEALHVVGLLAWSILVATQNRTDPWVLALVPATALVVLLRLFVSLVRARVVVDDSGIVIRRWRTRSWAWSAIARMYRDDGPLPQGDRDRRSLVLVSLDGQAHDLVPWHPSGRAASVQRFHALVVERAAAAGVDTGPPPPPRSAWWVRRQLGQTDEVAV